MPNRSPVVISAIVEGLADEALIRRLIEYVGASTGPIYGKQGKGHVLRNLPGYNQSARFRPWIVLLDLNHDDDCAPHFGHHCYLIHLPIRVSVLQCAR